MLWARRSAWNITTPVRLYEPQDISIVSSLLSPHLRWTWTRIDSGVLPVWSGVISRDKRLDKAKTLAKRWSGLLAFFAESTLEKARFPARMSSTALDGMSYSKAYSLQKTWWLPSRSPSLAPAQLARSLPARGSIWIRMLQYSKPRTHSTLEAKARIRTCTRRQGCSPCVNVGSTINLSSTPVSTGKPSRSVTRRWVTTPASVARRQTPRRGGMRSMGKDYF